MTLDEHDDLYVCCGKAGLKVFDRAGRPLGTLPFHAANACFGGPDFRTLMVASADRFLAIPTRVAGIEPLPRRV